MNFIFNKVKSPDELNILVGKSADYGDLHFLYTTENIQKYKDLIHNKTAFQLLVISENGQFSGFVSSSEKLFPEYLFLGELFVDPKFQKQGIATKLVEKVVEFSKSQKLTGVVTETEFSNLPTQKLYEKCGFQKINNPNWKGITFKIQFLV